ncbi:MAG: type II secretion system F family protein [Bdellovibrionota bacterium]
MSILSNPLVLALLFGIFVAIAIYFAADHVSALVQKKGLNQQQQVIRLLKLMQVEVNEKRISLLMMIMSFGLGGAVFLLFLPNIIISILFGLGVTILGWALPLMLVKSLYERRCTRFTDQMVDALTIMANGIKSGSNATQSMERVIEIMGNPISQEFKLVITQHQFGQSFEEALLDLGQRIPKPDVQMFVTAINILKSTGGNLSETFETIVMVIRERQKIEKKIDAMTAQGVTQGMIVSMIPFVLMGVFFLVDPAFIAPMFNTTLGLILLFVMTLMVVIGGVVIKKVVTIKV